MSNSTFIYVTYIRTTPEKLFAALIQPEFTRQYWQHDNVSTWEPGAEWKHVDSNNADVDVVGKVIESTPPDRLVLSWGDPDEAPEKRKYSRVTLEISPHEDGAVCLTVTHEDVAPDSGVRRGWPLVLSNLKTMLETGQAMKLW